MGYFDLALIIGYFVAMLLIGVYASKKQNTMDDYFLGGRNLSSVSIACLWVCGWIGASSIIGTAAYSYNIGIVAVWYVLSTSIGLLLFGFIMSGPVKRISDRFNYITVTDFMEARYDGKTGVVTTLCVLLSSIGTAASQFIAGAAILHVLTGWNLGLCYIITTVVITIYVSTGGLLAVTYTDLAQMVLLFAGIVLIAVPLSGNALGGAGISLRTALPAEYFSFGNGDWPHILALSVSTIISFFAIMTSYTRIITARSAKSARNGTIYAAIVVLIISVSATFLGMAAKGLMPNLGDSNNALAELIVGFFPNGIRGLVLVGILSAIMSTADISLVIGSTCVSKDIYLRYINPKAGERTVVRLGIAASVGVGVLAGWLGWSNQNILDVVLLTNTINAAGVFLPIVGAFFWKRGCSSGAFAAIISSIVIIGVWFVGGLVSDAALFRIDSLWPSLALSSVLFVVISLTHTQSRAERDRADHFYAAGRKERSAQPR